MTLYLLKLFLSAGIIVLASELAKRSPLLGAIIVSLPLVSIIALSWLYYETGDVEKVAAFARGTFWFVIPSLVLFIILPLLLSYGMAFYQSMLFSCLGMAGFYFLMLKILEQFGIKL